MNNIGQFEKVSLKQFSNDWKNTFQNVNFIKHISDNDIANIYNNIQLPERATLGSAGYDFKSPLDFKLRTRQSITIPTGIRVKIDDNWALFVFPRSSLGFKYRLQLDNTIGVIDRDYYNSNNEGHIFVKLTNDCKRNKDVTIKRGDKICQGIFIKFGITYDDYKTKKQVRNGGFGSTGS